MSQPTLDESNELWKYQTTRSRFFLVMYFITRILLLVNTLLWVLFTVRFIMGRDVSLRFTTLVFVGMCISFGMATLTQSTIRIR